MIENIILVASWMQIIAIPFMIAHAIADTIKNKKFSFTRYVASLGGLLFVMLSLAFQKRFEEIYLKAVENNEMPTYSERVFVNSILYLPPIATYFYVSYVLNHIGG